MGENIKITIFNHKIFAVLNIYLNFAFNITNNILYSTIDYIGETEHPNNKRVEFKTVIELILFHKEFSIEKIKGDCICTHGRKSEFQLLCPLLWQKSSTENQEVPNKSVR